MSTVQLHYATYHAYAGFVIYGSKPIAIPPGKEGLHGYRAIWLTCQVEAPHWGTVQSYDGAGMSGGLLHNIAVAPRSQVKGDLMDLVRACEACLPQPGPVAAFLASQGVDPVTVSGQKLQTVLSGPGGKVPADPADPVYQRAKSAILAFHQLFSDDRTFDAQMSFAVDWLEQGYRSVETTAYGGSRGLYAEADQMIPEFELAMCVYHAFSVNAPGIAGPILANVLKTTPPSDPRFAHSLIRALGTKDYAAWHDTRDNKRNRYDYLRMAAWSSPLWDASMTRRLMPENL